MATTTTFSMAATARTYSFVEYDRYDFPNDPRGRVLIYLMAHWEGSAFVVVAEHPHSVAVVVAGLDVVARNTPDFDRLLVVAVDLDIAAAMSTGA